MTVSAIAGITLEGQPQELSSFIRAGVVHVLWYTPFTIGVRRLSWKPHTGDDYTEVIPELGQSFHGISALYDPASDAVVVVWDDGTAVTNFNSGFLTTARFHPVTGALLSGPTQLFPGSDPKLAYRSTTQDSNWLLYHRTAKNGGVYGRITSDGGLTWQSGYPLLTGKINDTTFLEVAAFTPELATVAQLGAESRKLNEISMLKRTRPLTSIVKHPTLPNQFFIGEPSKFDNVTLVDNLRGSLVLATDNSKLYHLDGVAQGSSDGVGAVALITVTGTVVSVSASAGPTGNGDDVNSYTLVPAAGALNVDLPGNSCAVGFDVSSTNGYVAEYTDNGTLGQFVVVDLSTGTTGTVLSGLTGVRAVAVANFLSPPLIFVGTTEAGVERLRIYQENGLTPTLLVNTKLTSRANFFATAADPNNPTGAFLYASLVDRLNIYKYVSAALPVRLHDVLTLPGGGNFFQTRIAANGNVVIAAGNAGVVVLDPEGKILAQIAVSGEVIKPWVANTTYALSTLARPRDGNQFAKSRYYFRVTTNGISGNAEPLWDAAGTVADNTVVWTPVGVVDGVVTGVEIDQTTKRIYAVGIAGGSLGTDGRVWVISANGLL